MEQYKGFLNLSGLIVPTSTLKARFGSHYNDFLSKLTIVHHQKVGPPKRAYMYKNIQVNGVNCVQLPRTLVKSLVQNKILNNVDILLPNIRRINIALNIELYENQNVLIKHFCNNIFTETRRVAGTACGLLNLRAGMGKTFFAGGIIAETKLRTLYVVPKRPLMVQAVKDLRACFYPDDGSVPNVIIGPYGKTKKKDPNTHVPDQDVTVIVINSALMRDEEFFRGYSLVIYDEVHSYCSETRREIFHKASTHMCLGMSATTEDRNDGFDPIAHKELAFDGIIRAENVPGFTYEDVVFDCHARIINYSGPAEHTQNLTHDSTGRMFCTYMYNQFMNDPYRLRMAVNELIKLYDWRAPNPDGGEFQHHIYVFAEEIDILKKAKDAFVNVLKLRTRNDIVNDIDIPEAGLEMFTGGLKDERIVDITKNGRVLFSTFGYAGTGVSIQKMSAMLFLTPRKANMKQILARIMRRGSDVRIPRVVVDIVDKKTALAHQLGQRMAAYDFYNYKQELDEEGKALKVKYTDIILDA